MAVSIVTVTYDFCKFELDIELLFVKVIQTLKWKQVCRVHSGKFVELNLYPIQMNLKNLLKNN